MPECHPDIFGRMAGGYRRLPLTRGLVEAAVARARSLPIFDYSHREFDANLVGCIGELVFETFLTYHQIQFQDSRQSTERDYIVGRSLTVDVKTKDRTVPPRKDFDNSVPLYNHEHQRPHYYYFVSLQRDRAADTSDPGRFTAAYLLGGIDLPRLDVVGVRWNAGQIDPANGTRFWTACLNVRMGDLHSNDEMLAAFRAA